MVKLNKAGKTFQRKHGASLNVVRKEVQKYRKKDERKVAKKLKVAKKQEQEQLVTRAERDEVKDWIKTAQRAKGRQYEDMSVQDYFENDDDDSEDDQLDDDTDEDDDEDHTHALIADQSDDDEYDDEDDEDDALEDLGDLDEFEQDDEDDENDELAQYGGYFETKDDDFDDDEDDDEDAESMLSLYAQLMKNPQERERLKIEHPDVYRDLLKSADLDSDDDEDEDDENDQDGDVADDHQKQGKKELHIVNMTPEQYRALRKPFDTRRHTVHDILTLVKYFKTAITIRKMETNAQKAAHAKNKTLSEGKRDRMSTSSIRVLSSPLYNHFLQFALRTIPTVLVELIYRNNNIPLPKVELYDDNEEDQQSSQTKQKRLQNEWRSITAGLSDGNSPLSGKVSRLKGWTSLSKIAKIYFMSVFNLLKDNIDSTLLRLILRSILPAIPLIEGLNIPTPLFLKRLLHIWCFSSEIPYSRHSNGKDSDNNFVTDNTSRIEAFLVIRRLVMCLPHSSQVKDAVMKGVYNYFVRVSKFVNIHTQPTLTFLMNCIVEIYGIDGVLAYQYTFIYLRQLALQLRGHLSTPTSSTLRTIYNWQFINCLKLWGQILFTYATTPTSTLFPLIYPFAQISTSVLTLSSSPKYFPVRIVLADVISMVVYKCQVYIPISIPLLSILKSPIFHGKKHKAITKHSSHLTKELAYKLNISSGMVDTLAYKESIAKRCIDSLIKYTAVLADAVFFPEAMYPIKTTLKQLVNLIKIPSITRDLKQFQSVLNDTIQMICDRRAKMSFSPRDLVTKNINALTVLADNSVINTLNLASGTSGTAGGWKATPLHKLHDLRTKQVHAEAQSMQESNESGRVSMNADEEDDASDDFDDNDVDGFADHTNATGDDDDDDDISDDDQFDYDSDDDGMDEADTIIQDFQLSDDDDM